MYELLQHIETPFYFTFLPPLMPLVPGELFFLPVMLVSLAGGIALYLYRRPEGETLRTFLFPDRIYKHPDAWRDVVYFMIHRTLYPLTVMLWVAVPMTVAKAAGSWGTSIGLPQMQWSAAWAVAYTLLVFLVRDAGVYAAHLAAHRIPALWAFHKVHHTTRALNPFSAYRMHPVDAVWTLSVSLTLGALVTSVFGVFFEPSAIVGYTLLGGNVLWVGFQYLGTYHLRHSHIWMRYGPVLDRLVISPAHHQIHHSRAPRHWDKNMGQTLALWDWMVGTLCVPAWEDEHIDFGVSEKEDERFASVRAMFFLPFQDFLDVVRGTSAAEPVAAPVPTPATAAAASEIEG